uniref:Uncharacterized protein n=1 Tax=viral metagenome TaxID=1070528 RepID=A0A6M3X4S7_9ZZZZ
MQYAKVTLRGLTVCARVWNEGDLVPLKDLPKPVQKMVKDGEHPHLELTEDGDKEPVEE